VRFVVRWALPLLMLPTAAAFAQAPPVSVLVDLDPQRVDRSTAIESIAADSEGRLYVPDTVTGNIWRVDPQRPSPVLVGKIPPQAPNGLTFNRDGDLFIAKGARAQIMRIRRADLRPDPPGIADVYATGTRGANGIVFDRIGNAFVSGSGTGALYRVRPGGGEAEVVFHRDGFFPNGLAFDREGVLHISDTQRGEIWKTAVNPDGTLGTPTLFAKSPLLERVDGIAVDAAGTLWCAVQRNSIVTVTKEGEIREVARNDSRGPLEVPTAIVFVGSRAYVNNHDTVAPPNGDGKSSEAGVGASIAVIEP
jgi:sugar lactone lactonase YvrE